MMKSFLPPIVSTYRSCPRAQILGHATTALTIISAKIAISLRACGEAHAVDSPFAQCFIVHAFLA
jgi:hypothetical protein